MKNEYYIKNICYYEPVLLNSHSDFNGTYSQQKKNAMQNHSKSVSQFRQNNNSQRKKSNEFNSHQKKSDFERDEDRKIVICRKSKKYGDSMFIIEIFIQNQMVVMYLDNVKELSKYYLFIEEKQGLSFLREVYKNNIEGLVDDFVY